MARFPVLADLDAYLGRRAPSNGAMALRLATNRVVTAIGWDPRVSTRVLVTSGPEVLLPASNVTDVTVDPVADVTFTTWGKVTVDRSWSGDLTYTAGWPDDDFPGPLADVILEWAAAWLDNPRGLRSWGTGGESETYAVVAAEPFSYDDPRLAPFRVGFPVA